MNERLEQDLAAMRLAEPSAELDDRVALLLRVEHPLSEQPLREPSAALDARMARVFAGEADEAPASYRFAWASRVAVPLAACLAIGLTVFFITRDVEPNPAGPGDGGLATLTTPVEFEPVRYDETVVSDEAGDIIILDDQLPVVPIRRQAIQKTRWVDEANNIEIEMTVPREQTLIVPVQID